MEEESQQLLSNLLEKPENLCLSLLTRHGGEEEARLRRKQLHQICGALFQRVETLAKHYNQLSENGGRETLSGLEELYLGESEVMGERGNAEMIFGQVESQNEALRNLLKSAGKKLAKSVDSGKAVRLLEQMESDTEESSDDDQEEENDGQESSEEEEETAEERMKRRMERVMEEMEEEEDDDDDDDDDDNEEEVPESKSLSSKETEDSSSVNDPIAREMKDGFFDLNEMEAFADEEEEYLPDEAYGEEKPEKESAVKDTRSFHQKLREGAVGDDSDKSDSEEEEENDLLFRAPTTIRRKRYRADDEIEALHMLYDKPRDDSDDEEDAANMTAADIFGKPEKKFVERWNEKKRKGTTMDFLDEPAPSFREQDEDSWDDHNFGDENDDESVGRDEERAEGKNDMDEDEDEEVPMNDAEEAQPASQVKTKQQGKLEKQIAQLEQDMISEKPWQMKGEVVGTSRPQDSLLQSTPEFEVAAKQAPIITVEHTVDLEGIIKKRILDEDWDDVVPRELPDVGWNQKKGELPEVSQEKSKLGLGELYEREYLKKVVGYDKDAEEKETELDKAKNEMKTLFANLCSKLDALSNYHFAPRPVADDAEVRPVTKPAVAMEEVLPLHVSDARGVAPEEVYGAKRGREGVLRTDSELDQQDRKRQRSAKKAARRKARKEKLADEKLVSRLQPGLGLNNPYEKRKMREELAAARARGKVTTGEADTNTSYGKSTTFFKRMQSEAQQAISAKNQSLELDDGGKGKSKSSALKL